MNLRRIAAVAVLAAALAACSGGDGTGGPAAGSPDGMTGPSPTAAGGPATVAIERFTFMPGELEVEAGTTITFVNTDEVLHTVTAGTVEAQQPDRFDGQLDGVGPGDASFELTLDEPGTYPYVCTRHLGVPGMSGTIVVTE